MSFFASTVADVSQQMVNRATDLTYLHTQGFRSVHKAATFLRLKREIGYLTTPLVVQPAENNYFVRNSSDDIPTFVTALLSEVDKIRSNCASNPVCGNHSCTVKEYFGALRVSAQEEAEKMRKIAEEENRVANFASRSAQLKADMATLLAEAAKNLERENEVVESTAESSSSSAPPVTVSSNVSVASSVSGSSGFLSSLSSVFGLGGQ